MPDDTFYLQECALCEKFVQIHPSVNSERLVVCRSCVKKYGKEKAAQLVAEVVRNMYPFKTEKEA